MTPQDAFRSTEYTVRYTAARRTRTVSLADVDWDDVELLTTLQLADQIREQHPGLPRAKAVSLAIVARGVRRQALAGRPIDVAAIVEGRE